MGSIAFPTALRSVALLLVFGVTGFTGWHASSGRTFAVPPQVKVTNEIHASLDTWRKHDIRGRVLFLFDRHLNAEDTEGPPTSTNYVKFAVDENVVRSLYHVIPDTAWEQVRNTLLEYPLVTYTQGRFSTYLPGGPPLLILPLRDLAPTNETVLVNINSDVWNDSEFASIFALLKEKVLTSDLVVVAGALSPDKMARIREYEATLH